jgi:drug/metabolite transporter (DMT)-like permease
MRYQLAFATLITAATLSSFNGIFIRALGDLTDWQIVFWRHLLIGLILCLGLTLSYRSGLINAFRKIGRPGIFGAVAFGLSLLFLTMALHNSPIANVMFILALVPILTALLAWVTLRERIQKVTWVAMIGAAIGVALMVIGHLNGGSMKGAGLSVGCAVTVSIFAVILRWGRDLNMIPMFAVGSLIAAAIALPFAFNGPSLSEGNIVILCLWAGLVSPLYYSLFVVASRHIPVAELMLAVPLETILSVLLAWLVLAEIPSTNSLLGGIIVIAAVSGMAIYRIYQRPRTHTV